LSQATKEHSKVGQSVDAASEIQREFQSLSTANNQSLCTKGKLFYGMHNTSNAGQYIKDQMMYSKELAGVFYRLKIILSP
jgi:hypothetical protein